MSRLATGAVLVRVGAGVVRLYRWVEMAGPDRRVNPEELGRCVAGLHRSGPPLESASTRGISDQELGMVLLEFGLDEDRVGRLDDSYRSAGGPGRITSVRDLSLPAAALGHLAELACRQWLEAPDEAARSRAAGRVEEFLGEPSTLDVLERLVGMVRGA